MSATQPDPLHSIAVRIANVFSSPAGTNVTSNNNTARFAAQLSAIWSGNPDAGAMTGPPEKPGGLYSPDLNEPAVLSPYMQVSKLRAGLVGTTDSVTPSPPASGHASVSQLEPEAGRLQPPADGKPTAPSLSAADRRSGPPPKPITDVLEHPGKATARPADTAKVADNIKGHEVDQKSGAARKPSRIHAEAPPDPTSSATMPVSQLDASPQIQRDPTAVPATSPMVKDGDVRSPHLQAASDGPPPARTRSSVDLSTPLVSPQGNQIPTELSATAPVTVMPVDVADPEGRHDAAPTTGGAGVSLTVTYVPMAPSPTTPPDPVVLAGHDPGHRVADPLSLLVDAPLPAKSSTRLQRSSPDVDLPGEIDPLKSKLAKEDLALAGMVPIAPGTPDITTVPIGSGTAPQPGSALGPETLAQPNLTDFGEPASAPAQVGSSLLTLATEPDGSSQMALTLHPKELGTVHIQLDRTVNGAVRIVVTASEPGTLRSRMGDQAHLHAALDAASIPSAGRHLSFELGLAAVPAAAPGHSASPSVVERIQDTASASQTDAGTNVDMSGFQGADAQAGGGGRDPASGFSRNGRASDTYPDAGETDPGLKAAISPGLVQRSSSRINITA